MPAIEIDPQATKYFESAEYYSRDPYFSQRKDDLHALLERLEALPLTKHIPTKAVALICGLSAIYHQPFALLEHDPESSIKEKATMFLTRQAEITDQLGVDQPEVKPLKTPTLQVNFKGIPYYFLVCGTGDFRIDPKVKANLEPTIRTLLGVESTQDKVIHRTRINPEQFRPTLELGLIPGIVSPFADRTRVSGNQRLRGLLYCTPTDKERCVAVALSETDTLIVHGSVLRGALIMWQRYLNIPVRVVQLKSEAESSG